MKTADEDVKHFRRTSLRKDWCNSRPDYLEFILLCWRKTRILFKEELVERVELMLIERVGDVSYRVQLPVPIHPKANVNLNGKRAIHGEMVSCDYPPPHLLPSLLDPSQEVGSV